MYWEAPPYTRHFWPKKFHGAALPAVSVAFRDAQLVGHPAARKLQVGDHGGIVHRRDEHIFHRDRCFGVNRSVKSILAGLGALIEDDGDALNLEP